MFVVAVGIALGAVSAGATSRADTKKHDVHDEHCQQGQGEHSESCPTTTTAPPTTTTRPPTTTTRPPTTTTTKPKPTTTTTKPKPTTTTTRPPTTTTTPTTTATTSAAMSGGSDAAPPASGSFAPSAQKVGSSIGVGPQASEAPLLPPRPGSQGPPSFLPAPVPAPGVESPFPGGLTDGPVGVPLSMMLVIFAAGAATVVLVLRGALGRRGPHLAPVDEGETVGFG